MAKINTTRSHHFNRQKRNAAKMVDAMAYTIAGVMVADGTSAQRVQLRVAPLHVLGQKKMKVNSYNN